MSKTYSLPTIVTCNIRGNEKRTCNATAVYETENDEKGHAYYRCQKPECRGLVVVCFNRDHEVQR